MRLAYGAQRGGARFMIPRYARKELLDSWSDQRRYATWLEIELAACAAMEAVPLSPVPRGTAAELRRLAQERGPLDPRRIQEIEEKTRHDVIAFLTYLEELL